MIGAVFFCLGTIFLVVFFLFGFFWVFRDSLLASHVLRAVEASLWTGTTESSMSAAAFLIVGFLGFFLGKDPGKGFVSYFKAENLQSAFAVLAAVSYGSCVALRFLEANNFYMLVFPGWERMNTLASMGRLGTIFALVGSIVFALGFLYARKRAERAKMYTA